MTMVELILYALFTILVILFIVKYVLERFIDVYYIPDLTGYSYAPELHEGVKIKSIGWVGNNIPRKGNVPQTFVELLDHVLKYHSIDEGDLNYHSCGICDNYVSKGEAWLELNNVRYVMPMMIKHYIQAHNYKPPNSFLKNAIKYYENDFPNSCATNSCNIMPKDSFEGCHGTDYDSASN